MSSVGRRAVVATILASAAVVLGAAGPVVAAVPGAATPIAGVPPGYRPLTIKTLPPIPGVRLMLDATQLVTGADGTVRTLMTKVDHDALIANRDSHLRVLSNDVMLSPAVRGHFHGWYQEGYHFTPQNPVGDVKIATFDLERLTTFRFVDPHQQVLDAGGITDLRLRNSLGGLLDIGKPKPVWLRSARPISIEGTVILKDVEWRPASALFHATDIVQRGRPPFKPSESPAFDVRVKVFTVEFRVQDAFFGSPQGSSMKLTMPDGAIRTAPLRNGRATFEQLPSGDYDVQLDARGLGKKQAVSVTGDGPIELKVLSLIDVALGLGVLSLVVGAVLVFGLRIRRRRRRRAGADAPGTAVGPVPQAI